VAIWSGWGDYDNHSPTHNGTNLTRMSIVDIDTGNLVIWIHWNFEWIFVPNRTYATHVKPESITWTNDFY
jgi:hypothetical protein